MTALESANKAVVDLQAAINQEQIRASGIQAVITYGDNSSNISRIMRDQLNDSMQTIRIGGIALANAQQAVIDNTPAATVPVTS
jgi:hypothetical protein